MAKKAAQSIEDVMAGLDTVEEAQMKLAARRKAGERDVRCPVCKQAVDAAPVRKPRSRMLSKSMAEALACFVAFTSESGSTARRPGDMPGMRCGDFAKLVHWGLVAGTARGFYVVTREGREFVAGTRAVPERVFFDAAGRVTRTKAALNVRWNGKALVTSPSDSP